MVADLWQKFMDQLKDPWVVLGFVGQAAFFGRFVVQWIHSERHGRSLIPVSFWYLSLVGTALLFVYSVYLGNPVFIIGQGLGSLVYIRNLMLLRKEKRELA
jgi:lipid-A-disaccharide synthase-like uncharacterized protein